MQRERPRPSFMQPHEPAQPPVACKHRPCAIGAPRFVGARSIQTRCTCAALCRLCAAWEAERDSKRAGFHSHTHTLVPRTAKRNGHFTFSYPHRRSETSKAAVWETFCKIKISSTHRSSSALIKKKPNTLNVVNILVYSKYCCLLFKCKSEFQNCIVLHNFPGQFFCCC